MIGPDEQFVRVTVELTQREAWAFAQFVKRAGFTDYQANAENEDETYLMRDAGEKVRRALADIGIAPR